MQKKYDFRNNAINMRCIIVCLPHNGYTVRKGCFFFSKTLTLFGILIILVVSEILFQWNHHNGDLKCITGGCS